MSMKKRRLLKLFKRTAWEVCEIINICRESKFSFIIDECTDVSVSQVSVLVIRFYDEKRLCAVDALLYMVKVEDPIAEGLYKAVKKRISDKVNTFVEDNWLCQ